MIRKKLLAHPVPNVKTSKYIRYPSKPKMAQIKSYTNNCPSIRAQEQTTQRGIVFQKKKTKKRSHTKKPNRWEVWAR